MNKKFLVCFLLVMLSIYSCSDKKTYSESKKIAVTQYVFLCNGGTTQSCKNSCDAKCGIDSSSISSIKIDCINLCLTDCNRNCNSILLFLLNTKE